MTILQWSVNHEAYSNPPRKSEWHNIAYDVNLYLCLKVHITKFSLIFQRSPSNFWNTPLHTFTSLPPVQCRIDRIKKNISFILQVQLVTFVGI